MHDQVASQASSSTFEKDGEPCVGLKMLCAPSQSTWRRQMSERRDAGRVDAKVEIVPGSGKWNKGVE